ncbi:MAG TPA: hypothetical protein ENK14_04040 [Caldithrix sp.]|nr:hypothetical protein [Caldithrix sp.]
MIAEVVGVGTLKATTNFKDAVAKANLSLICAGTPSEKNGRVNLDLPLLNSVMQQPFAYSTSNRFGALAWKSARWGSGIKF